jgi:IQ and AAA domain-containing protein
MWIYLKILRKYPKRSLDDFIGDQNFAAHELILMNKCTAPHYGDIRASFRSMMLGMGQLDLPKVKSICIAGPRSSGKKFLVEAFCSEIDAVMLDLSAEIVAPINDFQKILALTMEMARKLQPAVIFINGCHEPFIRKISEEDKSKNPRKLGRLLMRGVVKKLKSEDAVMLIGVTNQPWNCNFTQLRQCYERILVIPPTLDYGTAVMAWNRGMQLKKIFRFDASSLAEVTRNFTVADILGFIESHIDLRRIMRFGMIHFDAIGQAFDFFRLPWSPLTCHELLDGLINGSNARQPLDEKVNHLDAL